MKSYCSLHESAQMKDKECEREKENSPARKKISIIIKEGVCDVYTV